MRTGRRTFSFFAAMVLAAQAQAIQITSAGQGWTVDWWINLGTAGTLSATSSWYVNSFSTTQIVLSIDITNTTSLTGQLTNADITTFGFGTIPNVTGSILTAGSTFDSVSSGNGPQQTFPGGFKQIDVCIFTSNCSGGSVNDGLHAGDTDDLQVLLTGDFSRGFLNLLDFPVKFQTSLGSYHSAGCINGDPACTPVPEPAINALLGLGLLLIGLVRYRPRRSAEKARRH